MPGSQLVIANRIINHSNYWYLSLLCKDTSDGVKYSIDQYNQVRATKNIQIFYTMGNVVIYKVVYLLYGIEYECLLFADLKYKRLSDLTADNNDIQIYS